MIPTEHKSVRPWVADNYIFGALIFVSVIACWLAISNSRKKTALAGIAALNQREALVHDAQVKERFARGYELGRRDALQAFVVSNAFLGPLVITNDNVTISNCAFFNVMFERPALLMGGSNITVNGCSFFKL